MLKSIFAASAGLAGCAHAFWRMECPGTIGLARMDPIVNVGGFSDHLHAIHGSNGFDTVADTSSLLAGDCTSCRVTQDMSSYWAPAMYFKDAKTGKFEIVEQTGGMLAYYLLNGENIKTFPKDFRMIAGDNKRRTFTAGDPGLADPAKSNWASMGETSQEHLEQRALGFNCLNYGKDPEGTLYRHFMPEKEYLDANCKDGLRLELMFPSCWDGKNTDGKGHKSHVAYPDLVMNGQCPDSHPVRLPGLLFETIWATGDFEGRDGMFVMSNGDPTGYGYHGDFIMGWEPSFLQKAINTCTNESGRIQDCPIFDIISEEKARSCQMKSTPAELKSEKILQGLSILPGGVKLAFEGDVPEENDNSSKEKPSLTYQPGEKPSDPADPLPGQVFKETSADAAPSSQAVVENAAVAEPTTTSKPHSDPVDPNVSYARTEYITNGNVVSKILWQEDVVWVTEIADSTTTVVAGAGAAPSEPPAAEAQHRRRAAHLHQHGHRHF